MVWRCERGVWSQTGVPLAVLLVAVAAHRRHWLQKSRLQRFAACRQATRKTPPACGESAAWGSERVDGLFVSVRRAVETTVPTGQDLLVGVVKRMPGGDVVVTAPRGSNRSP